MNDKINKEVITLKPFKKFCMTIGELPSAYTETMSYYEMLVWFTKYLQDTVIPTINNNGEAVSELQTLFVELQTYVNNYFDNLDVQEEINNKLDDMVEAGTLQEIITNYINSTALWCFDSVSDMQSATNLINGSFAKTIGYYSANDGGGAVYKITDTASALVHQETLSGGLYATLIIEESVNVKQFGAKGDGTTDDTTIIQEAINKSYNKLIIPKGTYMVSHLTIDKTFNLSGISREISIIKSIPNNTAGSIIELTNDGLTKTEVSNLCIHGNRTNNVNTINGMILWCDDVVTDRYTNLHDLQVKSCTGYGIYLKKTIGNNDMKELRLNNIEIATCNEHGLYVESASDSYFFEISSHRCLKHGFYFKGGNHKILNCKAFWNGEGTVGTYEDINRLPDQAFTETSDVVYDSGKTYYVKNNLIYEVFTGTAFEEDVTYYELTTNYQKRYAGFMLEGARNIITGCESQENFGDGFYVHNSNMELISLIADTNGMLIDNEDNMISYASVGLEQLYYGIYVRGLRKVNINATCMSSRVETIGATQKAPMFIISSNYVTYRLTSDENVTDKVLMQSGNKNTINGVCNNDEFIYDYDLNSITFTADTLQFYSMNNDNKSALRKIGNKVFFNFRINDTSGVICSSTDARNLFTMPSDFRPTENIPFVGALTNNSGAQLNALAVILIAKSGTVSIRVASVPGSNIKGVIVTGSYVINS